MSGMTVTSDLGHVWDVVDVERDERGILQWFSIVSRRNGKRLDLGLRTHKHSWIWEQVLEQLCVPTPADDV